MSTSNLLVAKRLKLSRSEEMLKEIMDDSDLALTNEEITELNEVLVKYFKTLFELHKKVPM